VTAVPAGSRVANSLKNGDFARRFPQCKLVGWGGEGAVFAVAERKDQVFQPVAAVKVIPFTIADTDSLSNTAHLAEFRSLQALESKFVVQVQEAWLEEPQFLSCHEPLRAHADLFGQPVTRSADIGEEQVTVPERSRLTGTLLSARFREGDADRTEGYCDSECSRGTDGGFDWDVGDRAADPPEDEAGAAPKLHMQRQPKELQHRVALCIRMELCTANGGETLRAWLDRGEEEADDEHPRPKRASQPLQWTQAQLRDIVEILSQLLYGVRYIHRKRLVHRDLKPANCWVWPAESSDRGPTVKIGDFGLSSGQKELGESQSPCGTPGYMAPELFQPGAHHSGKVDVYSCAVIFFELLHPPFATYAERAGALRNFSKGSLPDWLRSRLPKCASLLTAMAHADPALRIDVEEACKRIKDIRTELSRFQVTPKSPGVRPNDATCPDLPELSRRRGKGKGGKHRSR